MSGTWPSQELDPGERCAISEEEWYHFLESGQPLHQWGSAFLLDEGPPDGQVRVYLRDVSGSGHTVCLRLTAEDSVRTRREVARIEEASSQAADLVTEILRKGQATLDEQRAQDAASQRFVEIAERLYRRLLGG